MAARQILVFDNDRAFIALLQNVLGEHGFVVQVEAPHVENIRLITELKPEAIFIAADAADKTGYTLCNKARKLVGNKTPIIFATSTLSPHDLALHRNLKLHADIYLEKKGLTQKELFQKLGKLLKLEIQKSPIPQEEDNDLPQPEDVSQATAAGGDAELLDKTLALTNRAADAGSNGGDSDPDTANQNKSVSDQVIDKDGKDDDELQHLVAEQKREIHHLRKQLREARREASSSPFSEYFISMREQIEKKDLKGIQLKEKLDKIKKENLKNKKELKKSRKQTADLKKEMDQKYNQELATLAKDRQHAVEEAEISISKLNYEQKAHKETYERFKSKITDLMNEHDVAYKRAELRHATQLSQLHSEKNAEIEDLKQKLTIEVERAADIMIKERKARQEIPKQFEQRINQIQAVIEDMEKKYLSMLRIIEEKHKNDFIKSEEDFKRKLESIERDHANQLAKAQSEKNAEIGALEQKMNREAKNVADILDQEQKSQKETLEQYESKIVELEAALKDAEKNHLVQLRTNEEKSKTDLLKAEDYHNRIINSVVKKYTDKFAQLKSEMAIERQTYQKDAKEYESKIAKLFDQHAAASKKAELQHQQRASLLAELQSEKDAKIEALKKKINEKEEKVQDILNKKQ